MLGFAGNRTVIPFANFELGDAVVAGLAGISIPFFATIRRNQSGGSFLAAPEPATSRTASTPIKRGRVIKHVAKDSHWNPPCEQRRGNCRQMMTMNKRDLKVAASGSFEMLRLT